MGRATELFDLPFLSDPHRYVPRIVIVTLLVQIILSLQLWLPYDRTFPLTSLLPSFPVVYGLTGDGLLMGLLLAGALLLWLLPTSRFGLLLMTIALIAFILEDVVRLQPWIWFYGLTLWLLPRPPGRRSLSMSGVDRGSSVLKIRATFPDVKDTVQLRGTLLLVLAGLHLWSGIWKLNPAFVAEVVPAFLNPFGVSSLLQSVPEIGFVIPLLEIVGGVLLLFFRTRRVGIGVLGTLHLVIAGTLLVLGSNSVVVPWNLAVTFLLLFSAEPDRLWRVLRLSTKSILAILLFWLLPALRVVDMNDIWLSGELYSGNATEALFYFHESDRSNLPRIDSLHHLYHPGSEEESLLIGAWSLDDLNVPFYPEERYYRRLAATLCGGLERPEEGGVRISVRSPFTSRERTVEWECGD